MYVKCYVLRDVVQRRQDDFGLRAQHPVPKGHLVPRGNSMLP